MKNVDLSVVKAYFVPILVFITIIALIPLALGPIVSNLKVKNEQFQQKREQLRELNKKISDLEGIDATSENLKLIEAEKAVPSRKELSSLVIGVGSLAGKNSLLVASMTFTQPGKVSTQSAAPAEKSTKSTETAAAKAKDELTFTVTLAGTLENMKQFLADLESAKQLLGVSSIHGVMESSGSYRFDLGVNAPFKGIGTSGDTLAKPVPALTENLEKTFKQVLQFTSYTNVAVPSVPTGVENPF